MVRVGVVFPQTEIGPDPGAIRTYARAVEDLGFAHLLAYDHVLGADPTVHAGWSGPYDLRSRFHEPLVLFGFLAAFTRLELVTGILILPQRQTALVAKQAVEVELLSEGRFRLGVGLGWNAVEYEALGKDFTNRGVRMAEQVALLRALFSERSVDFAGVYESVHGAGLAPLPVRRPIPIWFGASSPRAYRRVGALADGWFPQVAPGPDLDAALATVAAGAAEAGRDPGAIAMEGRVSAGGHALETVVARVESWERAGATHVSLNTMGAGLASVDAHVRVLADVARALQLGDRRD